MRNAKPKKPKVPAGPRRKTIPFEKYSHLPPAIVDKKFIAPVGAMVWAFRHRGGQKPSWYPCKVMSIDEKGVNLWDEVAAQWFCFDPTADIVPDVRLNVTGLPVA